MQESTLQSLVELFISKYTHTQKCHEIQLHFTDFLLVYYGVFLLSIQDATH
jgi:hypothetical protein